MAYGFTSIASGYAGSLTIGSLTTASLSVASIGQGGLAIITPTVTSGKVAINFSLTSSNLSNFYISGGLGNTATSFDFTQVGEMTGFSLIPSGTANIARQLNGSLLAIGSIGTPAYSGTSMDIAILLDFDTNNWGLVVGGTAYTGLASTTGLTSGSLYPGIGATNITGAPTSIGFEFLSANITGVPAGYTALGGSTVATSQTTTALSLINQAFSLLGVLASGETLSAEDADTGLDILNNMLDSWNLERLNIYTVQDHTATLSGQTLTIGPGANIDVDRPIRLDERCFTRINGIDYGMKVVNGDQYASLVLKTLTSTYPYYVFYDGNVPTGTLYFWPQPPAPVEVHMRLWNQIQQFTSVSGAVYLPQGYRRAIIYSLAEELAPQFRNLDPNISVIASKARRNIKRANLQDNVLNVPNGLINRGRRFNIYTGE